MTMSINFDRIFQPIRLGSMQVKNRFVMAPMLMNRATQEGFVTGQTLAHYETRAKGGVGLIIIEEGCVDAEFNHRMTSRRFETLSEARRDDAKRHKARPN